MTKSFPVSMQVSTSATDSAMAGGTPSPKIPTLLLFILSMAVILLITLANTLHGQAVRAALSAETRMARSLHLAGDALHAYLASGQAPEYANFLYHMQIPLALQRARNAAWASPPNSALAEAELLASGAHTDDTAIMSWMMQYGRAEPGIRRTMELWEKSDSVVGGLLALGKTIHTAMLQQEVSAADKAKSYLQLNAIDRQVNHSELVFREQVEVTARRLTSTMSLLSFVLISAVIAYGAYHTRRIVARGFEAEASAQRARDRLEMATLSANDGIWDWHILSRRFFWTPRLSEMLGYDDNLEFRDYMIREKIHPDDVTAFFEQLRAHLGGFNQRFETQMRLMCRDHNYRWFQVRGMRLCDASNQPSRMLGTLTDIHEHTLTQQAAHSASTQAKKMASELALAVAAADLAFWTFEPGTGTILNHQHWDTMLGRDVMPRTFEGWLDLTHPDDRHIRVKLLNDHLSGNSPYYESEFRMLRANDTWVWVRSRGRVTFRDPEGRALQYAGAVMNITQQVEAREVHRLESEFLQAMIRGIDLGVMISDFDRVIFANQSLAKLLGYTHEDELGHEVLFKVMPTADRVIDIAQKRKAAQGQVIPARVARLKTHAQRRIKVVMNLSCVDWNGKQHFISTVSPLEEHQDLEVHLRSVEDRFELALASELEAQQAEIARELHDSLGSTLSGISLLLHSARNSLSESTRNAALERSQAQVKIAAEATRAMARGIMPVGLHPGAVVHALELFVQDLEEFKGIKTDFEIDGIFTHVTAEMGNHVYRVVQEATTNAIKHGAATYIQFSLRRSETNCEMRILDNGKGFDTRNIKNSAGIGIRSMQARAKAIRGTITMEGQTPTGHCLTLTWPMTNHSMQTSDDMTSIDSTDSGRDSI